MINSEKTREYFPSLNRVNDSNQQIIYLDGPGGTQVPIQVIEAISKYYLRSKTRYNGPLHEPNITPGYIFGLLSCKIQSFFTI